MNTVLLPGLHGTGALFAGVQRHLDRELQAHPVSYPSSQVAGYDEMARGMKLPPGPVALVAESYSGPLAIRIAAERSSQVRALVLVASFVRNPALIAARLGALFGPLLFRLRPPRFLLRQLMLNGDASDALVDEVAAEVGRVSAAVLAARLREIVAVDVRREFASLRMPTLFIAASRDRLVRPAQVRSMRALLPSLEIAWVEGPHLILQANPVQAAVEINRFLRPFT